MKYSRIGNTENYIQIQQSIKILGKIYLQVFC